MKRSLSSFFVLGAGVLLSVASAHAQQAPTGARQGTSARKPTPGQPVSGTAKRSSSTTKASGANSTSAAAASTSTSPGDRKNNPDTPNTVNSNGSIGSQESADSKGQGVYAAPGQPVNSVSGQKTDSYDGKAAKPASSTKKSSTLKPAGQQ